MKNSKNLYKYMSPDIAGKFFTSDGKCSLKLSYLKDYNDPFEFFLTIDYDQPPGVLAFYNEIISMVTQDLVTCFSKSPVITPMWAHYAANSSGFVAQIDELKLRAWLELQEAPSGFGDIDYQDTPQEEMQELLWRAHEIGKYRYIAWLRDAVESAAYYTKQSCWNYEQEKRLRTHEKLATKINDNLSLLLFPAEFVTAILVGSQASDKTKQELKETCQKIGCDYYEQRIGRSSTSPYFIGGDGKTFIFSDDQIVACPTPCTSCFEPKTRLDSDKCSWCNITPNDQKDAYYKNAFNTLHQAGLLEHYLQGFYNNDKS